MTGTPAPTTRTEESRTRLQACPACGARYNVGRIADGATFRCRRCAAVVRVGDAHAAKDGLSFGLCVAGILLLATLFLRASPGLGERPVWPWERFLDQASGAERAATVLWAAAGLWALVTSLVRARSVRAPVTLVLAAVIGMLVIHPTAGFTLKALPLVRLLGAVTLSAGSLLALGPATRRIGGRLAGLGGWALIASFALHFPEAGRGCELQVVIENLTAVIRGTAGTELRGGHLWSVLVPQVLLLAAAAFGVLLGLGARLRRIASLGFFLTLVSLVLPGAVDADAHMDGLTLEKARHDALRALVRDGIAIFALGCAAVADAARARRDVA